MQVNLPVDLNTSFEILFREILDYLNSNPDINHVTIFTDAQLSSTDEEKLLVSIARRLANRLQYAITPAPIVDCPFSLLYTDFDENAYVILEDTINFHGPQWPQESHESPLLLDVDTLVSSIDFDGCSDTPMGKQQIIDDILDFVYQYPSVKHIVVIIGSLRQSLFCDYLNAEHNAVNHNGRVLSCRELGTDFIEQLRCALSASNPDIVPPTVEFDPLMMSDILNHCEIGITYKAIHKFHTKLQNGERPKQFIIETAPKTYVDLLGHSTDSRVNPAFEWNDVSKLSTILVQMHHVAKKYVKEPDQKIYFRFYDDRIDILTPLYNSLYKWSLVPQKIIFDCAQNIEEDFDIPFEPIDGLSDVIHDYQALLLYLAQNLPTTDLSCEHANKFMSLYLSYIDNNRLTPECSLTQTNADSSATITTQDSSCDSVDEDTEDEIQDVSGLIKPIARKHSAYSADFFKQQLSGDANTCTLTDNLALNKMP